MGKSKFPGKPSKSLIRKRISILQYKVENDRDEKDYDDGDDLVGGNTLAHSNLSKCSRFQKESDAKSSAQTEASDVISKIDNIDYQKKLCNDVSVQLTKKNALLKERKSSKFIIVDLVKMVHSALNSSEKFTANNKTETKLLDENNESVSSYRNMIGPCIEKSNFSLKQKKTVTFKIHPESSDDHPKASKPCQKIPLVSIMKKECCNKKLSKLYNQNIVRPSRLTEILKQKTEFEEVGTLSYRRSKHLPSKNSSKHSGDAQNYNAKEFEMRDYSYEADSLNKDVFHDKTKRICEHKESSHRLKVLKNRTQRNVSPNCNNNFPQLKNYFNKLWHDSLCKNEKKENQMAVSRNTSSVFPSSNKVLLKQPKLKVNLGNAKQINQEQHTSLYGFGKKSIQACEICFTSTSLKRISHCRKYGAVACDICQKFIARINKKIADTYFNASSKTFKLYCKSDKNCSITAIKKLNLKMFRNVYKKRCSFCWLKRCIEVFRFPTGHKLRLKSVLSLSKKNIHFEYPVSKNEFSYKKRSLENEKNNNSSVTPFSPNVLSSSLKQINWSNALKNILDGKHHFFLNSSHNKISSISFKPVSNASSVNNIKFGDTPCLKSRSIEELKYIHNDIFNCRGTNIRKTGNIKTFKFEEKRKNEYSKVSKLNITAMPSSMKSQDFFFAECYKRQKIDIKGPRVKHVCRSASIALGQQIATFSNEGTADISQDSATILDTINCSLQMEHEKWSCINTAERVNKEPLLPIKSPHLSSDMLLRLNIVSGSKEFRHSVKDKKLSFIDSSTVQLNNVLTTLHHNIAKDFDETVSSVSSKQARESVEKLEENLSVAISIDFCDYYVPAEVNQCGFGIIISQNLTLKALCFICGSAGNEPLIFCACCCEPYHYYCLEDECNLQNSLLDVFPLHNDFRSLKDYLNWICPRCTACHTCNMSSGSKVKCHKCQKNYHSTCLGTSKRLLGADRPLVCANCLKCKFCSVTNVSKFVGNLPMCTQCYNMKKKRNCCVICHLSCETNDFDLNIIECGICQQWMHYKCEELSEEQYNLLSSLPECIDFICKICSEKNETLRDRYQEWRRVISAEFKTKLLNIIKLLIKTRPASVLLQHSHRKTKDIEYFPYDNGCKSDLFYSSELKLPKMQEYRTFTISKNSLRCKKYFENMPYLMSLTEVNKKVNHDQYNTLSEFNFDMCHIIESKNCDELVIAYKEILSEQFPWFQNDTKACTNALEEDMFDSCTYLQCEETTYIEQNTPINLPDDIKEPQISFKAVEDNRTCMLCKKKGEGLLNKESRLLYCGHNSWVHANCALWASNVFEEVDGSLQYVHWATMQGRLSLCSICGTSGATVHCNVDSCKEVYHFPCAQDNNCLLTTEKTVYCPIHTLEIKNCEILKAIRLEVCRPVYVETKYETKKFYDSAMVQFHIGSLIVKSLGFIHPKYSDNYEVLVPINFVCSRLYWSCKKPWKIVEYTLKTSLRNSTVSYQYDTGTNFTVNHSNDINTVQLELNQISLWHKSLARRETNNRTQKCKNHQSCFLKPTISDERLKNNMNYDEINEEEQQTNTDLLPPEIKDAIFEDLPHEILDGISMVDIFPKLMIYDDIISIDERSNSDENLSNQFNIEVGKSIKKSVNKIDDETQTLNAALCSNKKKTTSNCGEFFSKKLSAQYLSTNFNWSRKLENDLALKKRKFDKILQSEHFDKSFSNLNNKQKNYFQNKSLILSHKTKKIKWDSFKRRCDSNRREQGAEDKLMQLDGIDDFISNFSSNISSKIDAEVDHYHSIYKINQMANEHSPLTYNSYPPHQSKTKSNSIYAKNPCTSYIKEDGASQIFLDKDTSCLQNISFTVNNVKANVKNSNPSQYQYLFTYESPLNERKVEGNFQISNGEFYVHKPYLANTMNPCYPSSSNVSDTLYPNIAPNIKIDVNTYSPLSLSTTQPVVFSMPASSVYQIPQVVTLPSGRTTQASEAFNRLQKDENQPIEPIEYYQVISSSKLMQQPINFKATALKHKVNATIETLNNGLHTQHETKSIYEAEGTHVQSNENRELSSLLLPSNSNAQPLMLIHPSSMMQNISISNDVSETPVQHVTFPIHNGFKTETTANIMSNSNIRVNDVSLSSASNNNVVLTNAVSGLQTIPASPIFITQCPQSHVVGTIMPPQNLQNNFIPHDQVVGNALDLLVSPQLMLVSQPSYYGLETVVQNTVMSSQQFVSSAIQGILSQNASFSATTTQVFQASKLEPVSGYLITNNPVLTSSMPSTVQNYVVNPHNSAEISYYHQNQIYAPLDMQTPVSLSVENDKIPLSLPTQQTQEYENNYTTVNSPAMFLSNMTNMTDFKLLENDLKTKNSTQILFTSQGQTYTKNQVFLPNISKNLENNSSKNTAEQNTDNIYSCKTNVESKRRREKLKLKKALNITNKNKISATKKKAKLCQKECFDDINISEAVHVPRINDWLEQLQNENLEFSKDDRKQGLLFCKSSSLIQGNQFHHNISLCYKNNNLHNIPTNIVSPMKHHSVSEKPCFSRPTNRVLPMQLVSNFNDIGKNTNKLVEDNNANKSDVNTVQIKQIHGKNKKSKLEDNFSPNSFDLKQKNELPISDETSDITLENTKCDGNSKLIKENLNSLEEKVTLPHLFRSSCQSESLCENPNHANIYNGVILQKENVSKLDYSSNSTGLIEKKTTKNGFLHKKKDITSLQDENVKSNFIKSQNIVKNADNICTEPHLLYEIQSDDGFIYKSSSITEIWEKIFESVQLARRLYGLWPLPDGSLVDMCGTQSMGLKTNALKYLIEQLPGVEKCVKYTPKYHRRESVSYNVPSCNNLESMKETSFDCSKCQPYIKRSDYDMFSWLASKHRKQPEKLCVQLNESELIRRGTGSNLPMAMKYRTLKETYKGYVGVFRSYIHGRGLYCTKDIESGEMVIEYAGEVIRSTLTDKRERSYNNRGIGCYMFKINENLVVDATMKGNAARFINHSCEPNCYSKVVDIFGYKHIIIFTLRRIIQGEELTYDYKFPFEDEKIPCSCGSKKCRKYLN